MSHRTLCENNLLLMTHLANLSHSSTDLPYMLTRHSQYYSSVSLIGEYASVLTWYLLCSKSVITSAE